MESARLNKPLWNASRQWWHFPFRKLISSICKKKALKMVLLLRRWLHFFFKRSVQAWVLNRRKRSSSYSRSSGRSFSFSLLFWFLSSLVLWLRQQRCLWLCWHSGYLKKRRDMGPKLCQRTEKLNIIRKSQEERGILNAVSKTCTPPSFHTSYKGHKQ